MPSPIRPPSLRIQYVSDLHGRFKWVQRDPLADVLVVAGDLGDGDPDLTPLFKWPVPVVYVLGNHEFYGEDVHLLVADLRRRTEGTNVHFLEQDVWTHRGVRFLGCTGWTDFCDQNSWLMTAAHAQMSDYRRIGAAAWLRQSERMNSFYKLLRTMPNHDVDYTLLHPCMVALEHQNARRFLSDTLSIPFDGPTVVVTHHPPSPWGLRHAGRWMPDVVEGMPLALLQQTFPDVSWMRLGTYAGHMDGLIQTYSPNLWIHGHIHQKMAYWIGDTPVLTNAIGHRGESSSLYVPSSVHVAAFPYEIQRQSQILLRKQHIAWMDRWVLPLIHSGANSDSLKLDLVGPHAWRLHCEALEQCFLLTDCPHASHMTQFDGSDPALWLAARDMLMESS
jgi:predicted phosphodiesterase